jgi:ribonuclease P protein component
VVFFKYKNAYRFRPCLLSCINSSFLSEVISVQKRLRLRKRQDFAKTYRHGKASANHQFVIYCRRVVAVEQFRFGISASKKIGNAVVRNLIRRRVKEIIRTMEDRISLHYDIVCIVRKPALELDYLSLQRSLLHILKRAGLLESSPPRKQS